MENEARRHHYIPQFILRNFNNENEQLFYWNIAEGKLEKRHTRSVFMNFHMYRDEINHEDAPTAIESSLSVFEREIAELIRNKVLDKKEIILTRRELESMRIFLSLLSFRSNLRMEQYRDKKFFGNDEELLKQYTNGGDFEDLWKREIEALSKCRSYEEIEKNTTITPTIKMEFFNELKGQYMTVADARGGEFLITDIYPTLEIYPVRANVNLHMHVLFPISPTRVLILNHIMFKMPILEEPFRSMVNRSQIKGNMIVPPKNKYEKGTYTPDDLFIYNPTKIYEKDVNYINALLLNEARVGIVFRSKERIQKSIEAFNSRDDTKVKYLELEKRIADFPD